MRSTGSTSILPGATPSPVVPCGFVRVLTAAAQSVGRALYGVLRQRKHDADNRFRLVCTSSQLGASTTFRALVPPTSRALCGSAFLAVLVQGCSFLLLALDGKSRYVTCPWRGGLSGRRLVTAPPQQRLLKRDHACRWPGGLHVWRLAPGACLACVKLQPG